MKYIHSKRFICLIAIGIGSYSAALNKQSQQLFDAIEAGSEKKFTAALLKGGDARAINDKGDTLLIWAAKYGKRSFIPKLLNLDATIVNHRNHDGDTALMWASKYGNTSIVKQLLNARADVSLVNNRGKTALLFAVSGSHEKVTKLLLDHGTSLDEEVFIAAIQARSPVILKLLLEHRDQLSEDQKRAISRTKLLKFVYENIIRSRKELAEFDHVDQRIQDKIKRRLQQQEQLANVLIEFGARADKARLEIYQKYGHDQVANEVSMEGIPDQFGNGDATQGLDIVAPAAGQEGD